MKQKIWLFQVPIVILFCGLYAIGELATEGRLSSEFLRKHVFPTVRSLEGKFTDIKFRTRGPIPAHNPVAPVVIVKVDDATVENFGRWPWHRDLTAKLIEETFNSGALGVGLDIVFAERDPRISEELREALNQKGVEPQFLNGFETDLKLQDLLLEHGDRLVLGYSADVCQPSYSTPESPCVPTDWPRNADASEEAISESYQRFKIHAARVLTPDELAHTPIFVAEALTSNVPGFNRGALFAGAFNPVQDLDGVIRRVPLTYSIANTFQPSLSLALAGVALGKKPTIQLDADGAVSDLRFEEAAQPIPVSKIGLMDLNFRGGEDSFPWIPAELLLDTDSPERRQALTEEGQDPARIQEHFEAIKTAREMIKGKIVLIGVSATGAFDTRTFPFGANIPGVLGHATAIDNMLAGDPLIHASDATARFAILFLMSVGALILAYFVERLTAVRSIVLFVGVLAALAVGDFLILFNRFRLNLNTSLLGIELLVLFVLVMAAKYILEEKNKKFIKLAFSKYVSPSIVDSILKDPSKLTVGGEKRDLTILFSDIRSFTTFSENMDAKRLSTFLNEYLGKMTDLVFENDGTLDKYIGDAVMCFWGAPVVIPRHALKACQAAIAMQRVISEQRPYYKKEYGVDVAVGIGINTGAVSVGNMGSERIFEYTVIGDHVNLASRLEGLTKYYGVKIVTTRFTFDEITREGSELPPHRVLDFVKVKGKKNAIELIQVLEGKIPDECRDFFAKGREYYRMRQWDDAIACFLSASESHERLNGEPDGPSQVFVERCQELKNSPPNTDWEGSWEMTSK